MSSRGRSNTGPPSAVWLEVLKATKIPLIVGFVCFSTLIAMWYYGLPWRSLALVVMVLCIGGPFIVTYSFLFNWLTKLKSQIPVLIADEDQTAIGLLKMDPGEFGSAEVDGDELPTRDSMHGAGKVYIAEDFRVEQREEVAETGEKETVAKKVLQSSWEADLTPWEWVEKRDALKKWREVVTPIARGSVEARAAADPKALANSDRLAHGLLLGAEKDNSFIDTDEANPFDWDVDADLEDMDDLTEADDQDEDREEKPDPGSLEMQKEAEDLAADLAADGGNEDA